jgi:hypothetical protein
MGHNGKDKSCKFAELSSAPFFQNSSQLRSEQILFSKFATLARWTEKIDLEISLVSLDSGDLLILGGFNERRAIKKLHDGSITRIGTFRKVILLPLVPYLRHTLFNAHFWQKSPPKKFRYKAHVFKVKIYLLKNEVILGLFKLTNLNFVSF